jgi:hypothetical protein
VRKTKDEHLGLRFQSGIYAQLVREILICPVTGREALMEGVS